MKGISNKEIEMISWLELEDKRFFTRDDIKPFFKNTNLMNFYLSKLKKKKRIVKINKRKYYLVPIQAYQGYWAEHPYIIVDEIFNGKNYYIGGISAANYWHLIEQIPVQIDVYCNNKQGCMVFFNAKLCFKRQATIDPKKYTTILVKNHPVNIATKRLSKKWSS
ncbi:hypothetical protein HYW21_00570 [Candidatus Woesearchaeota archaeon]|nr:hypothetical protein [Candidatus Woesearchaeota archaeon]